MFLICLKIIAKYSAMLEPVTQLLQAVDMDMFGVRNHIDLLLKAFRAHREGAERVFSEDIMPEVKTLADKLGVDLTVPRRCARQIHRSNVGGTIEEYYRRTTYIPYMDSLIQSLEIRFGDSNKPYFNIFKLHPKEMQQTERGEFKHIVLSVKEMYGIDNLVEESLAWYDLQRHMPLSSSLGMIELVKHTNMFPAVRKAILIALTLPATSCEVERSFSTLRRVKTWLRTSMSDQRLSGICMLSVHRDKIKQQKNVLINKIIDKFGRDPRRLQFLFQE
uniref:Zinc finger MYM-type protein 1-like n=1 Tax=Phallusia mammillata TaxID=59560 RepID=A0A6F9DY40_9ASCI|nr:zinc finger MYM-type protein 1-like [Phallusia mammillata]